MNLIKKLAVVIVALGSVSVAQAGTIGVSVELDLLQFESNSFQTTMIDFVDVILDPGDRLVLDVHFVNGQIGVFSDPTATDLPGFQVWLAGSQPFSGFCCTTPTLLGTTGDLLSDTLVRFAQGFYLLDGFSRASFTYSGLRLEAEFLGIPVTSVVESLFFGQQFFNPIGGPLGDSRIYRVPETVPEPGTFALFTLGLLGMRLACRRAA